MRLPLISVPVSTPGKRHPHGPDQVCIWDIPPHDKPAALPEAFLSAQARIFIAKRPDTLLPGLSRAIAYGQAYVVDQAFLLVGEQEATEIFTEGAADIMRVSGGWSLIAFNPTFSAERSKAAVRASTGWRNGRGHSFKLDFQNEFLTADRDGKIISTTPDLITLLEAETPVTADSLRYGLRLVARLFTEVAAPA